MVDIEGNVDRRCDNPHYTSTRPNGQPGFRFKGKSYTGWDAYECAVRRSEMARYKRGLKRLGVNPSQLGEDYFISSEGKIVTCRDRKVIAQIIIDRKGTSIQFTPLEKTVEEARKRHLTAKKTLKNQDKLKELIGIE